MKNIPLEARQAIAKGINRGDCVVEMEAIGLPQRTINALEFSKFKIIKLEDLLQYQPEQLREINNFGERAVEQIVDCLCRYNELDQATKEMSI